MWNKFIHHFLRVPFTLHVRVNRRVRKPQATYVLLHGIGNSGAVWDAMIDKMPSDVRIITVDLLGFGKSPKPTWATYDAKLQARSVITTLIRLRHTGPMTIIGHSLGSLVAVEIATLYPRFVSALILCSPPFYKESDQLSHLPNATNTLKRMYKRIYDYPNEFIKILSIAKKYGLVTKAVDVNDKNIHSYIGALEASVLNQTAFDDITGLSVPIHIIHGRFDVLIVSKYLKRLAKKTENITIQNISAGHEMSRAYITPVVSVVLASLNTPIVRYNKANE